MTTVLITGANRGVGLALVKHYAALGNRVLACCRDRAAASALQQVSGDIDVIELQITEADSVAALVASYGGQAIDILINNAGTAGPAYADQTAYTMDFDGFAETFAVNTIAPVRIMQALLPDLRASSDPKVVNITSQMGAISLDMTMGFAYCSSKAALNKFMKLAAIELGKEGIHVCLIHPGWVQSDMGGPNASITTEQSAEGIADTITKLNADTNGSFWKWNGDVHAW